MIMVKKKRKKNKKNMLVFTIEGDSPVILLFF